MERLYTLISQNQQRIEKHARDDNKQTITPVKISQSTDLDAFIDKQTKS